MLCNWVFAVMCCVYSVYFLCAPYTVYTQPLQAQRDCEWTSWALRVPQSFWRTAQEENRKVNFSSIQVPVATCVSAITRHTVSLRHKFCNCQAFYATLRVCAHGQGTNFRPDCPMPAWKNRAAALKIAAFFCHGVWTVRYPHQELVHFF